MSEHDAALQEQIDGLKLAFNLLATCLFREVPILKEKVHAELDTLEKNAHRNGEEGSKFSRARLLARELFISKPPRS